MNELYFGSPRPPSGPSTGLHVILRPGTTPPLRLGDAGALLPGLAQPGGRHAPQEQVEAVCRALAQLCDPWSVPQRLFLEGYFDFLHAEMERNRAEIGRLMRPHGAPFKAEDRIFSALFPLPQAHLPSGNGTLRADFAFWTGETIVAVISSDARWNASPDATHSILRIDPEALRDDPQRHLARRLPAAVTGFWRDEGLPLAPFGTRLPADIEEIAGTAAPAAPAEEAGAAPQSAQNSVSRM